MLINSRSFAGGLDDAEQYLEQRRMVEPPVYNENRLKEKPIPEIPTEEMLEFANMSMENCDDNSSEISIEIDQTLATETDPLANSLSGSAVSEAYLDSTNEAQQLNSATEPGNEIQQSKSTAQRQSPNEAQELNSATEPGNEIQQLNLAVETNENAITEDKRFVPLFDPVNDAEINELLDDIKIVEYEDVTMVIKSSGLPKPMQICCSICMSFSGSFSERTFMISRDCKSK